MVDIVLNILLFTPLGAGLALLGMRPRAALPLATALTVTIEVLQYRVIPGRDVSLRDVLCNTLGVALGIVVAGHWRKWLLPVGRSTGSDDAARMGGDPPGGLHRMAGGVGRVAAGTGSLTLASGPGRFPAPSRTSRTRAQCPRSG
jgi:hypothetical protein